MILELKVMSWWRLVSHEPSLRTSVHFWRSGSTPISYLTKVNEPFRSCNMNMPAVIFGYKLMHTQKRCVSTLRRISASLKKHNYLSSRTYRSKTGWGRILLVVAAEVSLLYQHRRIYWNVSLQRHSFEGLHQLPLSGSFVLFNCPFR